MLASRRRMYIYKKIIIIIISRRRMIQMIDLHQDKEWYKGVTLSRRRGIQIHVGQKVPPILSPIASDLGTYGPICISYPSFLYRDTSHTNISDEFNQIIPHWILWPQQLGQGQLGLLPLYTHLHITLLFFHFRYPPPHPLPWGLTLPWLTDM